MRSMRLLGVFCLTFCAVALARAEPAGKVLTADGDALVLRGSQILRLSRGAAIESGDQIHTGADSKVLIAFTDSSLVWIRANSDFIIDEYSYAKNGRESAFFSLLKGGVRSVTGLIGRRNRMSYRLRVAVATIGIRGTDFSVVMCQRDCRDSDGNVAAKGLYGEVIEGRIAVTPLDDRLLEREFGAGEFFQLADERSAPTPLFLPPPFLRNKADEQTRVMERLGLAVGPGNPGPAPGLSGAIGGATNRALTGNLGGGLTGTVTSVAGVTSPVVNSLGSTVSTVTSPAMALLAPTVSAVTPVVTSIASTVSGVTSPVMTSIAAPAVSAAAPVMTSIAAPAVSTVTPIVTPIAAPVVSTVAPVITPIVAPVVSTVAPVITPIAAPVVSTVAPVITPIAAPAPSVTLPGTVSTILPSGPPGSSILKR
jgi:hypothetical protein